MKTNTLLFFLCMVFMPLVSANSSNVNNQKKNSKIKVPIYTSYNTQVSGGSTHSLIVKPNGELWGCGDNNHCELGFNIATISTIPIKIMDDVASASAGCYSSLVVKKDGTLWRSGEHETYYTSNKTIWEKVSDNVAAVAAAVKSFVYLKQDGSAWVSGRWITDDVVSIAAGWYHFFFIKSDGSLWASGLNVEGVLGLGNKFVGENISTPEKVTDNVAQVASCNTHTLILKKDGTLWTCGENKGLLGKNGVVRYPSPTKVTNNVKSIAVGNNHSLFVKYDGSLWATGSNEFGQLGINYGEYKELWNPKQIASNVVSIAAGYDHTLLTLSDGSVWTCGNNERGQLGIGFTKLQWDEITKIDKWEKCLPTDVTISPKSATIPVGGRLKLNYTVSPSNAIKNVTWRSDNNNVASCYEGTVNGYKKGVANIYIETANGIVDVCEVTVKEGSVDPTAITISPSSKTINVGESFQASYTLTPSNATTTVTWSSDNTNIATVSSSGVVKGIKAGSTYINVKTANGKTDYFKVTVKEVTVDPTAITISPSSKTINVGESFQASYTLTPSNATTTVTWSSDNTNIATVSSSGVVKGIKAGSTYINVKTANGKTDWFKVTVKESPKLQLSATPSGGEVEKGTIVKLVAKANGSTVSADIYYTTNGTTPTKSSTKYTSSGIVINSGCTIKAIAYKDGYETSDVLTAKYTINNSVTVPTDISISLPSNLIMVGDSVEATYTLIPSDAATTVTWSSEDSEIAEVKASGNSCTITGKTFGETTINAKTSNGKTASCKVGVFVIEGSSFVFPTEIEPSSATIHVGDSIKLFPSFSDFDFSYYSWTSEDSNIAKTNSSGNRLAVAFGSGSFDSTGTGVVVGVMPGKTIITGRFHNGASLIGGRLSFMGSCEITVMESMSIESMKIDSEIIQPVFSLSGQRLSAPRKGLNIIGGKKVMVK